MVGVPSSWVPSVTGATICPCPFSDHCAVTVSVSVPDVVPPGPGLWKLNTSIPQDQDYVDLITGFWRRWRLTQARFSSLSKWWEKGKSKIKGLSVKFCCQRAASRRGDRAVLVSLVDHLKSQVDRGSTSCVGPYRSALAELERRDTEAAQGLKVRARIQWAEDGETSSAYFFHLVQRQTAESRIADLRDKDGTIISDPDDILRLLSSFYKNLFTAEDTDPDARASLLSNIESRLSPAQAGLCEGPLTLEECHRALAGMARGKTPGLDGLPMEFYLAFWDLFGADLVEVLNSCSRSGRLSPSQRSGVISLSFKKGDRLDLKNWRRISLLGIDYKIASRAIAGRLLKVIEHVVAPEQTCGVPGRYIGENVALLRDVVTYATSSGTPVAILSLDQEKAFDRVDWSFLHDTLQHMGFGPSFTRWFTIFYTDVRSAVKANGHISQFFHLSRGVRQGCPLSPLLYVLYAEVLACTIRANPTIKGVQLPGAASALPVLSLYADDTSLVLSSDQSIRSTFSSYSLFESGSGSKLNQAKSKGRWLGVWSGRVDPPVALEWSSDKLKSLGVYLGPGNLEEENWRPRFSAVENVLRSWRQRDLSLRGRSLIIGALALARVWYVASLIHMPPWVMFDLNKLIFRFFWKGKPDRVSRDAVVQPTSAGGFGVVSIRHKVWSLHAQWIKRFASSPFAWASLMSHFFGTALAASPLQVFSWPHLRDLNGLPEFYKSLVLAWRALDGGFSAQRSSLVLSSRTPAAAVSVAAMSCKLCYNVLLGNSWSPPHCVAKFAHFGDLYWFTTWRQLFFCPVDRPVIDLSWKIAHGVVFTAARLCHFGYDVSLACFCGERVETLDHLFFYCPLAQSGISWFQSLLFRCSPLSPVLVCRHLLFGFSSDELCVVPRGLVYALNVLKYFIWLARNDHRFRDIRPSAVDVLENVKVRLRFNLPVLYRRFKSSRRRRYFHRQWGARGVLAAVVDGRLILKI